jgi:hypothetical protein
VLAFSQGRVDLTCTISDPDGVEFLRGQSTLPPFLVMVDEYAKSSVTAPLRLPATLTSQERALVHARATTWGLTHRSTGTGADRAIEIGRP